MSDTEGFEPLGSNDIAKKPMKNKETKTKTGGSVNNMPRCVAGISYVQLGFWGTINFGRVNDILGILASYGIHPSFSSLFSGFFCSQDPSLIDS